MHTIYHQVGIRAQPARIYDALTTSAGIAGWWTDQVDGRQGRIGIGFGSVRMEMEVERLEESRLVVWKCVLGHPLWEKTRIEFDLSDDEKNKQTLVDFKHAEWTESGSLFRHCSTKWAVYLLSLKNLVEKGKGAPYPHDIPVNHSE